MERGKAILMWCVASVLTTLAWSHPGNVDDNGGHLARETRLYHCHHDDCLLPATDPQPRALSLVSFNIQFLGNGKHRDNSALAALVADHDVVVVQELVAPPYAGQFPNGNDYRPDAEAAAFFEAMAAEGFAYVLSEEDTGTGDRIHLNSTATEWWVAFYKADAVQPAPDLPHGYLASDRSNHPDYERVPYAFSFRAGEGLSDFVVISVHLKPGDRAGDTARRQRELAAIADWIDANDDIERDFFVVGDMNFEDCAEIDAIVPASLHALNQGHDCQMTNTNVKGPRPYDNILIPHDRETEFGVWPTLSVIDLIEAMRNVWANTVGGPYPGDPYDHNRFRARYSDHHPIVIRMGVAADDDGS